MESYEQKKSVIFFNYKLVVYIVCTIFTPRIHFTEFFENLPELIITWED